MTKIKPCGHYVLVKPVKLKKKTESGFILPESMVNKENVAAVKGTLVAIGPTAWKAFCQGEPDGIGKPWAKIGDEVHFKRYVSDRIIDENDLDEDGEPQEYFLFTDENILAVMSN